MNQLSRAASTSRMTSSLARLLETDPQEFYALLRAYYDNNGLYDRLREELALACAEDQALKPLRNPAPRVVEFYAALLWPGGTIGISPKTQSAAELAKMIRQVWSWSNWHAKKQVAVRWQAMYGDVFTKVATKGEPVTQVYFQLIDPQLVVDFQEDERGYLTWIRFDVPQVEVLKDGRTKNYYYTEIWDKPGNRFRAYRHQAERGAALGRLGTPMTDAEITAMGIDFIPVVHVKNRDVGDKRGVGAYAQMLDQIDEANRIATRLHQILFRYNKPLWALQANSLDATGRPMPAPQLGTAAGTLNLEDDTLLRLPGNSTLQSLVPPLDYKATLDTLNGHLLDLERNLPELAWSRLREEGRDLSGRAIRLLLGDALARLAEARENAVQGLIRANQMALTIGQVYKLWQVGEYAAGALDHDLVLPDPAPLSDAERSEIVRNLAQAKVPTEPALHLAGYTEVQVQAVLDSPEYQAQQQMAALNLTALSGGAG
jgi:hypothetical protein